MQWKMTVTFSSLLKCLKQTKRVERAASKMLFSISVFPQRLQHGWLGKLVKTLLIKNECRQSTSKQLHRFYTSTHTTSIHTNVHRYLNTILSSYASTCTNSHTYRTINKLSQHHDASSDIHSIHPQPSLTKLPHTRPDKMQNPGQEQSIKLCWINPSLSQYVGLLHTVWLWPRSIKMPHSQTWQNTQTQNGAMLFPEKIIS